MKPSPVELYPPVEPHERGMLEIGDGIAAGFEHTCAVLADGTVACWGGNESGQLGNGSMTGPDQCKRAVCALTPVAVKNVTGAVGLAAGFSHTCALGGDGTVQCWGDNTFGGLGDGTATNSATAVPVKGVSGVTSRGNAMEAESHIDKSTEIRHRLRAVKTALELAIVARAPTELLNRLARPAGLLEAVSQLPIDGTPTEALIPELLVEAI